MHGQGKSLQYSCKTAHTGLDTKYKSDTLLLRSNIYTLIQLLCKFHVPHKTNTREQQTAFN